MYYRDPMLHYFVTGVFTRQAGTPSSINAPARSAGEGLLSNIRHIDNARI